MPDALDRANELIVGGAHPVVRDGYLDVMGEAGVQRSVPQQAMQSRILPLIYEKLWRPVAFGVASLGLTEAAEATLMRELLEIAPGDTVLDVACGPGNTLRRLVGDVGDEGLVIGVDAAAGMLARAVEDTSSPNVAYVRADGAHLPFGDQTFDAVACFGALYLVDQPFAVLRELVRVLAPGGRIAILTSCARVPGPLEPVVEFAGHHSGFRWFGPDTITGALEEAGLTDIRRDIRGLWQFVGARRPG